MVIVCDIDDTLCNLQETTINIFNERFGSHYKIKDFTEYNIMNVLPVQDAISMIEIYGEHGLYDKVKPLPGAQKSLEKLINLGHNVYLVTAAIAKTYGEKVDFIKRYFPYIDDDHIVSMKHKWMLNADIMIEDNLETLLAKPNYHRICLNMPWNQSDKDWVYGVHRCHNWNEIMATVNKISEVE